MSCSPGTSHAAGSRLEPPLEGHVLDLDVHPGTLVEPGRPGRVLRVDAERGTGEAPPAELAKGMTKQREPEAPAAPGLADAEHRDEAPAAPARFATGERRELVPVADEEP